MPYSEVMTTAATGTPLSRLQTAANHHFTDEARKARYGVAYVQSLCAHAGVDFKEGSVDSDYMAIDGTIEYPRVAARVQIKCTSQFKVGNGNMSLQLKPSWITKWTESATTVFVVVVKVPKSVPDWLEHDALFTRHGAVAFGKRFDPAAHQSAMVFTADDKLTTETIYDWRQLTYDIYDGLVS